MGLAILSIGLAFYFKYKETGPEPYHFIIQRNVQVIQFVFIYLNYINQIIKVHVKAGVLDLSF